MTLWHRTQNRYNNLKIFITATERFWRWQAKEGPRTVAQQVGNFSRDVSINYARRFARLKAQAWITKPSRRGRTPRTGVTA